MTLCDRLQLTPAIQQKVQSEKVTDGSSDPAVADSAHNYSASGTATANSISHSIRQLTSSF
ncbi:hypothetical protein J6590_081562 [Homalodisca vitripennis]|nr:hypothetical protein J6590_081562 [Homalodisca vitripennis]